jgi:membrane protein YdbS with pleckstrin-like domain
MARSASGAVKNAEGLQRLDPRTVKLWWVSASLWALAASFLALFLVVVTGLPRPAFGAVVLLAALAAALLPPLRYRRWRYALRERDLYLARGALFSVETLVPFDRIQFVETRQGPLDRAMRLTQVAVYTAAGRAARLPGLKTEEAQDLREELSKVAGTLSV